MTDTGLFNDKCPLAVVLGFDGTITDIDVVDGILVQFAQGKDWIHAESDWVEGKISSHECLKRQLKDVRVTEDVLKTYLNSIAIDPGFKPLKEYLCEKKVPLVVLSDGFDLLIEEFFKIHDVEGVRVRSNQLRLEGDQLIPSFPYYDEGCGRCAHCKRKTLQDGRRNVDHFVFVGDGLSDVCALDVADTIFAKGKLDEYCKVHEVNSLPYRNLHDVMLTLPPILDQRLGEVSGVAS